jgi:MFS superfamily sulfate permease-like transporter
VVVVASVGLISPGEFRAIRKVRTMEFRWALIAMVGVMLLGTLKGILVAVIVSLVALILHVSRRPVYVLGASPGPPPSFVPCRPSTRTTRPFPACCWSSSRETCILPMPRVSAT